MDLKECGKTLNMESFKNVEIELGGSLPTEYKMFMVEHNGGRPVSRLIYSFMDYDSDTGSSFENGFDIYSFNKLEDIVEFYDNLFSSGLIPEHYCPIADDSCGNELLLCLSDDENYGSVFFVDHEQFNEDESFKVTKIANDFENFIKKLVSNN